MSLFATNASAQTGLASGTNTCCSSSDNIDNPSGSVLRLAINLNSGQSLDAILDIPTYPSANIILFGPALVPGVTEHPASVNGGFTTDDGWPSCVGKFQTFSLLEKNGIPYGNRIGQYVIAASETYTYCTGSVIPCVAPLHVYCQRCCQVPRF
jgi:hypothetical protein